jgi:hypothetical protein
MEAGHPMNKILAINPSSRRQGWNLVLAAVIGVCAAAGSTQVNAQSTAGMVFGKAPAGDTISAHSTTNGTQRAVRVRADGRYAIRELPVGVYTVTLEENGQPVLKHPNVPVGAGRGSKVDFDCAQGQCAEVASKQ